MSKRLSAPNQHTSNYPARLEGWYRLFKYSLFVIQLMPISKINFIELERSLAETKSHLLDYLAPEQGKVYVISITRDDCPACKRQKPKLEKLAEEVMENHGRKVLFTRIHVKQKNNIPDESLRSKNVIGHYFYPTNMILLRTKDRGAIELYRNVSPNMSEIKRTIDVAVKIVEMM